MLVSGSVNNLKEREQKICYYTYKKNLWFPLHFSLFETCAVFDVFLHS